MNSLWKHVLSDELYEYITEYMTHKDLITYAALEPLKYVTPDTVSVVILGDWELKNEFIINKNFNKRVRKFQGLCYSHHPEYTDRDECIKNIERAVLVNECKINPSQISDSDLETTFDTIKLKIEKLGKIPKLHDLRHWASQGVLMLTKTLPADRWDRVVPPWEEFCERLVEEIASYRSRRQSVTVILQWTDNEKFNFTKSDCVFNFTCTSPKHKNFYECDHFSQVNDILNMHRIRRIKWLETKQSMVGTDGACEANGKLHAAAGYGVVFLGGTLGTMEMYGGVRPCEYKLVDPENPIEGFAVSDLWADRMKPSDNGFVAPTNNRGEYLAGCYALLAACRAGLTGCLTIVSDSRLYIDSMEKYLPARRLKGTGHEMKNYDLLTISEALLKLLRQMCRVNFVHQKSHTPKPTSGPVIDALKWKLNAKADEFASIGKYQTSTHPKINGPFTLPEH